MAKSNFALGAIFAAAAGFVAGVLTAPKSGKETRGEIQDAATKVKDTVVEEATKVKGTAEKKAKEVKAKAEEVIEDVKEKATEVAHDVAEKANELKDRADKAVEGAKKGASSDAKKKAAKK